MAVVRFSKKKSHQIYRLKDGTRVPGGSTISGFGEPTQSLMDWNYRCGVDGLDPQAVMRESGDIGTVTHGLIQCSFNGDVADFSEFSETEISKGKELYEKFMRVWQEQGLEFVASEVQLVSEKHGYGGTLDLIARRRSTGKLALLDAKTSASIYTKHLLQIAGYEYLYGENHPEEPIEDRCIIRLDKKVANKTDVRWLGNMESYFRHFLNQLACYNSRKEL